jgi:hypothetical protein
MIISENQTHIEYISSKRKMKRQKNEDVPCENGFKSCRVPTLNKAESGMEDLDFAYKSVSCSSLSATTKVGRCGQKKKKNIPRVQKQIHRVQRELKAFLSNLSALGGEEIPSFDEHMNKT